MNLATNLVSTKDEVAAGRLAQWHHAARVLAVPEFAVLSWLTDASGALDLMIIAAEKSGQHIETMALADHWILGFFEILRISRSADYRKCADPEFTAGDELEALRIKANMVRSAFAKLSPPGKHGRISPSHSSIGGKDGIVFAVYDHDEREIDINRKALADEFLALLGKLPPSRRFEELMKAQGRAAGAQILPV